jgi:hypothetical protein
MKTNLNCKNIDHLLYLTDDEIDSHETLLLSNHIESCSRCKKIHEDFLSTRQAAIRFKQALPDNPDLVRSIEDRLSSGIIRESAKIVKTINPVWQKTIIAIRYISGVAAALLLILFISEQTLSVRKISMLENRIHTTVNPSMPGLLDRITIARASLSENEWNELRASLWVKNNTSEPHDLLRLKMLLEKRLRSENTSEMASITLFRHSPMIKRNTITFKNLIK